MIEFILKDFFVLVNIYILLWDIESEKKYV